MWSPAEIARGRCVQVSGTAAETTTLPWFAIGGITEANIDDVLEAGATRVAVSSGVVRAERPRRAAAILRARMDGIEPEPAVDD